MEIKNTPKVNPNPGDKIANALPGTDDTAGTKADSTKSAVLKTDSFQNSLTNKSGIPFNDKILYVGLNPAAGAEIQALQKTVGKDNIIPIYNTNDLKNIDKVEINGKIYNLGSRQGIEMFIGSLTLDTEERKTNLINLLNNAEINVRDGLAKAILVFSKAYGPNPEIPSRLIISGHSDGENTWGDNNQESGLQGGEVKFSLLVEAAKAMPEAASQIEDLHISACYAGGRHPMAEFKEAFPNLKTIWGYRYQAPAAQRGAAEHIKIWEKATKGRSDTLSMDLVKNHPTTAMWDEKTGYHSARKLLTFKETENKVTSLEKTYNKFFTGDKTDKNTNYSDLRTYYNSLQDLINHPDLNKERRTELLAKKSQALRLIFYSGKIDGLFEKQYSKQISAGYAALGQTKPDFSQLSRKEAIAEISKFESTMQKKSEFLNKPENKLKNEKVINTMRLLNGLKNLTPEVIPSNWM
jgi:hypothetical protein